MNLILEVAYALEATKDLFYALTVNTMTNNKAVLMCNVRKACCE